MARIAFIEVTATVSYGGVQTAVWNLADNLATFGHSVSIFGGRGDIAPPVNNAVAIHTFPFTPRERVPNIGSRFQRIVERITLARYARDTLIRGEYDWAILTKPFDFFWPWISGGTTKTRFALLSGGTDFYAGDRALARRIDGWFTCSHFNAWQIRSRYKRQPKVIFNGVDTEQFAPSKADAALRARLGVPNDAVLFTFAGRLVGWKGLSVAVRALADPVLRDIPVRLLIIGNGPERRPLADEARRLGVEAQIIFHDPIPHNKLPALYAAADIGLFPSIGDEAFGITIAEAMSCGKPVIASYVGGIPEVVGNEGSCGLLIAPADPNALARGMRELALDPPRRLRMGEAARARIASLFTWRDAAQRLLLGLGL